MSGITNNNSGGGNSNSNSNSNPTRTPTPTTLRAVAAYIPPHLRNKKSNHCGSSSNTSNGTSRQQQQQQQRPSTTTISSSSISSQSRWSNLDSSNDHNNHNDHNNSRRTSSGGNNGNGGNGGNSSSSSSSSRWSNVDRSSITSLSSSSSREGGGHGHGHGHGPRSSYNNNRRISGSYNNTNTTTDNIQAIFFGDSFIKLFGLLNDFYDKQQSVRRNNHHHVIAVHKYKAASAKGLTKSQNENSIHILKTISRINDKLYPKLERLVFCFGSVDVHMSYYYKKYVQNESNFNLDSLKQIAVDYIDFIVSLPIINNNNSNNNAVIKILIIGIYPSPLLDSNVGASLKAYGSLETQQQVEAVNQSTDCVMYNRLQRVLIFNNTLKERCHYYNNLNLESSEDHGHGNGNGNDDDENTKSNSNSNRGNNCILEYDDVVNDILSIDTNKKVNDDQDNNNQDTYQDQDQVTTTSTYTIKDIYRDVSDLNIHLIHETLLQLWITKWSWYKDLTILTTTRENDDDIGEGEVRNSSSSSSRDRSKDRKELSLSFVEYLQETFIEYRKTKPWAKRKSVIEIDGIH